jgi:hypothetical protein
VPQLSNRFQVGHSHDLEWMCSQPDQLPWLPRNTLESMLPEHNTPVARPVNAAAWQDGSSGPKLLLRESSRITGCTVCKIAGCQSKEDPSDLVQTCGAPESVWVLVPDNLAPADIRGDASSILRHHHHVGDLPPLRGSRSG